MMIDSRRQMLKTARSVKGDTHPGLWYDKFLTKQTEKRDKLTSENPSPFVELVKQCCKIGEPTSYKQQFVRWRTKLAQSGALLVEFDSVGKIALGMGNANVIENGITIHHTYGVPYLPGSSLKGITSSYAHRFLDGQWRKGGGAHNTLFGTTDEAGFVTFYDALPLSETVRFHPEIMTVHHRDYYASGKSAPADWDNPNPISFLTFSGTFLVALAAPYAKEWLPTCVGILKKALWEMGIGAKTSSGYGRLQVADLQDSPQAAAIDTEQSTFDNFKLRLDALSNSRYASELGKFAGECLDSPLADHHRHNMARAVLEKVTALSGKQKRKFQQKTWYQALNNMLESGEN